MSFLEEFEALLAKHGIQRAVVIYSPVIGEATLAASDQTTVEVAARLVETAAERIPIWAGDRVLCCTE